jgi:hypothetical protein
MTSKQTGPTTAEGKRKSSMNALKHGMYANAQTLQAIGNPEVSFNEMLAGLRKEYRPVGVVEEQLVRRIARCLWRLANGEVMERRLIEKRPNASRPGISYEKVLKYERLVDIHLHRALIALERKREIRAASHAASIPDC